MTSKLTDFMCIDYPAFVKNDAEAIRTLGGIDRIEQVFQHRNGKLLLNFNPDNIFSKTLCSTSIDTARLNESVTQPHQENEQSIENCDPHDSKNVVSTNLSVNRNNDYGNQYSMPCLLMSVKKSKCTSGGERPFEASIVGSVKRFYNFQKIADFQYLPMTSHLKSEQANNESNSSKGRRAEDTIVHKAFYDSFKFDNIDNCEQDLRKNLLPEYFLLPPYFSRFDDPVNYGFKRDANTSVQAKPKSNEPENENHDDDDDDNDSESGKKSKSTRGSPSKKEQEASADTADNSLIRSVRQERSSQAILITFKSDLPVPQCIYFIFLYFYSF